MKIDRRTYADHYGPTTGDRIRLADTELIIEIEKDFAIYGEEVQFGGGKVVRDSQGQSPLPGKSKHAPLDLVITNAVVLDHWGIVKGDVGVRAGRVVAVGKAGNPLIQPGVDLFVGGFLRHRDAVGEIGVSADDRELRVFARILDSTAKRIVERFRWSRRSAGVPNRGGEVRRMLVDAAKAGDELLAAESRWIHAGKCWRQWLAMSMRRANQTSWCLLAYATKRSTAANRPGRPASRQWRPTDIIFGAVSPSA